ncbi:dopamine D2-like receptor [Gigantopelta aegis]|uniref:dopamine D2-like receptor n=1 Tax=Gigantopelta aegis TaxID=1735272 RepID=UPI001B88B431|nr:dopamine D2-like receptor [Gigantopelta aegis]
MDNISLNCDIIFADLPPPPPPKSPANKSAYCMFMVIFSLITVIGNSMVIAAVAKFRALQKRTNAFIVSVACADIGVAVLVMPFRLYEEWNGGWDLGKWFCLVVNAFDGIFCMAYMCNLYTLALERYLAVCQPFLHMKIRNWMTALILTLCWVFPIVLWPAILFTEFHIIGIEDLAACVTESACPLFMNTSTTIVVTVGTFWTPSALMILCYWRIFQTARHHAQAIHATTVTTAEYYNSQRINKTVKAAKTPAIIVGCFSIFWLPYFTVITMDAFMDYKLPIVAKIVTAWMAYVNSMVNPFLYYIFNQQLKMAFKNIMRCKGGRLEDMDGM